MFDLWQIVGHSACPDCGTTVYLYTNGEKMHEDTLKPECPRPGEYVKKLVVNLETGELTRHYEDGRVE